MMSVDDFKNLTPGSLVEITPKFWINVYKNPPSSKRLFITQKRRILLFLKILEVYVFESCDTKEDYFQFIFDDMVGWVFFEDAEFRLIEKQEVLGLCDE